MAAQTNAPLPDGLELGGYRILNKIASGGFSIVYLAQDPEGLHYAIKEYLPSTLVKREAGELVPLVKPEYQNTYRNGLKCFFEEGRALARILHPNVVRVLNFFRANETVYMVMGYEQGRTLQEVVLSRRGRGDKVVMAERHIRKVFLQVMNGLREVHSKRLLHLDLKPANVYLRTDGSPMLLDFGAARQTLSIDAPKLFPMYTPGFAAPELYRKSIPLGPWTDAYGLGATMFACMAGSPPQPADQRQLGDRIPEQCASFKGLYSSALIEIVAWCLKMDPMERPQSVFALQKLLRSLDEAADDAVGEDTREGSLARLLDSVAGRLGRRKRSDASLPQDS